MLIHNAAQQLKRKFERAARPYGMTLQQWRVLSALSREDGQTQTALGQRLEASPMTVSDILERLESSGLLTRESDPSDSRAKLVRISAQGRDLVAEIKTTAAGIYGQAVEGISAEDLDALERGLKAIAVNLDDSRTATKGDVS